MPYPLIALALSLPALTPPVQAAPAQAAPVQAAPVQAAPVQAALAQAAPAEPVVRYREPGSAASERARRLLERSGVLGVTTAPPVEVVARDCAEPKASWNPAERRVTICYSLVDRVRRDLIGISETEEADARTASARVDGALAVIFHHQLGHALADTNRLTGGEDLADRFAALTLAAAAPQHVLPAVEARHLLAQQHPGVRRPHGKPRGHLAGPAESALFACLLYGSDPVKHARIAQGGFVPRERAPSCPAEYQRAKAALGAMTVKVAA
ncbi:DUF4344 domain-containing metallopeptidase [Nonomuraea antri]|uniref:DUF4344 domain-containing metallopeptidase n=1 Tax=Nonomuraea antri TaxID=2730852 RepID=UPI0015691479|nr:DUF4344 domain-containing metallopeptidase [Nonomuraea antri]